MLLAAIILFSLAIILLWISVRQQHRIGLPTGRIIYSDTGKRREVVQPLYDSKTGLAGKPDYLVQHKDTYIPVEVKSKPISQDPYPSHIFQLAAYCSLVEGVYDKRPSHGLLQYPNRTIAINYTPELESKLHQIIAEIRDLENEDNIQRSHKSIARCKSCGFREICDQALG